MLFLLPLLPTFLALFGDPAPTDSYQAIVVNATTSQPLAGAAVLNLGNQAGSLTDPQGRFTLPGPVAHFRVRSLGFADLEATRPALAPGQVDTLRLLPKSILLPEASVRPAKPVVLSSLGTNVSKSRGTVLVPGGQYGVLFQPAATLLPAAVQQIRVRFEFSKQSKALVGRVRVRLVAPERGAPLTPSAHDLVPIAATYTAAELAALPDHVLTVDLSAYNLRLPATGFFVLLEGLATTAEESYVTDKLVGSKGAQTYVVVTATDPHNPATFRETNAFDYPVVAWASSVTDTRTVTRLGYSKPWTLKRHDRDAKKVDNVDMSLTILAD